ncbi:MAG: endonuclease V [Nitrososphaerota archaeon]
MRSSPYSRSLIRLMAELQMALAGISYPLHDALGEVRTLCAVDAAHVNGVTVAASVTYDTIKKELIEVAYVKEELGPPYLPGFLAFREAAPMAEAVRRLTTSWDLLLVDGHGKAHPRLCGLATLLGFILGRPSVGVAKSLLVGEVYVTKSGPAEIRYCGEVVGFAVGHSGRWRFYVSQGYGVSLGDVRRVVEMLGTEYPVALWHAHSEARRLTRKFFEE